MMDLSVGDAGLGGGLIVSPIGRRNVNTYTE
jgi:hypothetical protein